MIDRLSTILAHLIVAPVFGLSGLGWRESKPQDPSP